MTYGPAKPYYVTLTDNSVTAVATSGVLIHALIISNPDAADAYLQLFNVADADDVTLGSTAPTLTIPIDSTGNTPIMLPVPVSFDRGLSIAATVEPAGGTDTASDMIVNIVYDPA